MLISQRCFVTIQFHIKVGIVIYIKRIFLYEEKCIQASVADISRSPLVVKIYRSIDQTDDLEVFDVEVLELVLVVLVRYLYVIAYMISFVSDTVSIHNAFIRVLRQPSLGDIESVQIFRQRDGFQRA